MHKVLLNELGQPLDTLIVLLVDAQIYKEDNFSKTRVQFLCALRRFLGFDFTKRLFERADSMIHQQSTIAHHVVAPEIFADILHSIKSCPYSYVECSLLGSRIPFILVLLILCLLQ